MKDKRELLKNGTFGVMDNGKQFVIVGENFIYQEGGFDSINGCDKDLNLMFYKVNKLVEAVSFNNARTRLNDNKYIIYDRNKVEETCMTIAEIEEKLGIKNLKIIKEK